MGQPLCGQILHSIAHLAKHLLRVILSSDAFELCKNRSHKSSRRRNQSIDLTNVCGATVTRRQILHFTGRKFTMANPIRHIIHIDLRTGLTGNYGLT